MKCAFAAALLGIVLLSPVRAQTAPVTKAKTSKGKAAKAPVKTSATHRRASRRAPPRPSYQLHPDPERYQQIQQALAERGYFKGQVNGEWGDDSVDALKRFQADQKLDNDGKINALTLTGLGLGPRHEGAAVTSPSTATSNPTATPSHADASNPSPPVPAAPTPAPATPPR
jgi:Putative peptidoglycan binding domain